MSERPLVCARNDAGGARESLLGSKNVRRGGHAAECAVATGPRRAQPRQIRQPREVVSRHRQRERLIHLVQPADHHLPHRPDHLGPAEALLNARPLALAGVAASEPPDPRVDGAAAYSRAVLRHIRRHIDVSACPHELSRVVHLVCTHRDVSIANRKFIQHDSGGLALGGAASLRGLHVDHEVASRRRLLRSPRSCFGRPSGARTVVPRHGEAMAPR